MTATTDGESLANQSTADLIAIARIARPQGLRGEVIADLMTDFPERFARLREVRAVAPNGEIRMLRLEQSRLHKGRILLKFAGYDKVEQAETLRETRVMIERTELVHLPENNWYEFELIDCEVVTLSGQELGRVVKVESYGAAPLLDVRGQDREYLIPLALDICKEVDTTRRRILVDPPEGLLDL